MDDNIRGFPGYHITKEGKLYRYGKFVCEETIRRTINQCLI